MCRAYLVPAAALLVLAGCSSINVNLWPFGDKDNGAARSTAPADATAYHCDGKKTFYVRTMYEGKSVWVILPERQVRLDAVADEKVKRYAAGSTTLTLDGATATLAEGTSSTYTNCSTQAKTAAK